LLGVYYERGELVVDRKDRLWVLYRHYYAPWIGRELITHKEKGWGVYARCLTDAGWSGLIRFDVVQGDGMQRLSAVPLEDGIAVAYTAGRTDRRMPDTPRGIAFATVADPPDARQPLASTPEVSPSGPAIPDPRPLRQRTATVGGKKYELFFGDLHRHTDLSLCDVPTDGTIDDTYRYAIDVARLDFLGITDHARDIAQGDVKSQLWWRSCKEVTRHALLPEFIPYFSYERSRGGADHNVISLKPDVLTPHTYPHAQLWTEIDDDTFTIPHQTITSPIENPTSMPTSIGPEVWRSHDNARRPLMEIYQGCRDRSIEHDAHPGLAKRYLFGFIASSDHFSTGGSYAGVWAEKDTRESIFRAMKARRTFGATDRMRLLVRAGDHWMGEVIRAKRFPPIRIEAAGTATIAWIEILVDGALAKRLRVSGDEIETVYAPETPEGPFHYLYVRVTQADGKVAWSSPIWIEHP
jgi:hypothetical protein